MSVESTFVRFVEREAGGAREGGFTNRECIRVDFEDAVQDGVEERDALHEGGRRGGGERRE